MFDSKMIFIYDFNRRNTRPLNAGRMESATLKSNQTGQTIKDLKPVFCFHATSADPGRVTSYPAVSRPPFFFSVPGKIHLYPVYGFEMGVVR